MRDESVANVSEKCCKAQGSILKDEPIRQITESSGELFVKF